jgi:hypothetical protein
MSHDTYAELRDQHNPGGSFDGSEPFMTGGHQILSPHAAVDRVVDKHRPEWVEDAAFKALLLREFPNMDTDEKQRDRAGRWNRAVYLYYRVSLSALEASGQMGLTVDQFKNILKCIRRVAVGRRCDNRKAKGLTPRGRMKGSKVVRDATGQHVIKPVEHDPIQSSSGITELVENDPFKTSLGRGITSPGAVTPSHPGEVLTSASPSF